MSASTTSPGLVRLKDAAAKLGICPDLFRQGCEAGQIPVSLVRLGNKGLIYAKSRELEAFLAPAAPEIDLFSE